MAMLHSLLDALPLSSLPKLTLWEARSLEEGNLVIDLMRRLHRPAIDAAARWTPETFLTGFSITARREVAFGMRPDLHGNVSFREAAWCPLTHVNARARIAFHLFVTLFERPEAIDLYMTEQETALHALVAGANAAVTGSEYLPGTPFGTRDARGIRSEDLTSLSFADASFDGIISLDVLEHIPDFRAALGECARVLRPGGTLILTAPFAWTAEHVVRARIGEDGAIEHLLPPEYHGDPINANGILCFYWFGWTLLDDLKAAGFRDARVALVASPEFGYFGEPISLFLATR